MLCFFVCVSEADAGVDVRLQRLDRDALLRHRIAVAHGHAAVGLAVEIVGHAQRRADFVEAAVALADGAAVVVLGEEALGQLLVQRLRGAGELLGQRQHGRLHRRERGVDAQHGADVARAVLPQLLLVIGVDEQRQRHAVGAERRLDDVGDVLRVVLGVEVAHILPAVLGVRLQVEIGAVGHAPQLAPAEREEELEVGRCVGIVAQLLLVVVAQTQRFLAHTEVEQEFFAEILPVRKPLQIGARLAEEFQLHLLELARAEGEVARRDFVAEGLADLRDAEGHLAARGALHVLEVDEDALRRLGAQIDLRLAVLGHALKGLEHHIELADGRELAFAAARAGHAVAGDVFVQRVVAHSVDLHLDAVLLVPVLDERVGAVAHPAVLAVDERVVEVDHMPGRDPDLGVHQDGAVQPDVVRAFLHEALPPRALDVVLQLHAERAVVPRIRQPPVNLAAAVDKASALAVGDDFIHCLALIVHHNRSQARFPYNFIISFLLYQQHGGFVKWHSRQSAAVICESFCSSAAAP